jgi:hypothetical protein
MLIGDWKPPVTHRSSAQLRPFRDQSTDGAVYGGDTGGGGAVTLGGAGGAGVAVTGVVGGTIL